MTQGIIALDIDGTTLSCNMPPPQSLVEKLFSLYTDGWKILFATGRTLQWSEHHLKNLPFPFFLACYNGACIISYPEKKMIHSSSLLLKDLMSLTPYAHQFGVSVYELGGENKVFIVKEKFTPQLQKHLDRRQAVQREHLVEISSIEDLPDIQYASARFFIFKKDASFLMQAIEENSSVQPLLMKDSFDEDIRIIQITAKGSSKGGALRLLRKKYPLVLGTIAAGDDTNDIDLLEEADIGIAVGDAPQELRKIAYSVAASPENVHSLLDQAITVLKKRKGLT